MSSTNGTDNTPGYFLEVMDAHEGANSLVGIMGDTATGKTQAVKTLIARAISAGARVCIIDMQGDYHSVTKEAGGTVMPFYGTDTDGMNPLRFESHLNDDETYEIASRTTQLLKVCGINSGHDQLVSSLHSYISEKSQSGMCSQASLKDYIDYAENQDLKDGLDERLEFLLRPDSTGLRTDDPPVLCIDLKELVPAVLDATFLALLSAFWSKVYYAYKPRVLVIEHIDRLLTTNDLTYALAYMAKRSRPHRLSIVTSARNITDYVTKTLHYNSYNLVPKTG